MSLHRTTPPPIDQDEEIAALIATLLATERRLEELTGGEVDTVADRDGRTFVLHRAQGQIRHTEAAKHAKLDLALQRQQTELRVLFDLMPALIWFKDTKNRIIRVNQRVAEMAGRTVEEIEGRPSQEIYPDQAAKYYADDLEVIQSGVPKLGIVEKITNVDGQERWVLTDKVPVLDKAGEVIGIVVTARDITEQKQAEEAIRESEERFAAAFVYAPIGVALVSLEGRWLKVNRALCSLFGYSEAELLNRTIQDIAHPEDVEVGLENVRQGLAGELHSLQIEKRYIHKRGNVITALLNISLVRDAQGQPLYFVSQIQDITERRLAEDKLRASNQKFHQLADNITDVFWIRSADMSEVQYVSPAFERIWGRSVASLYSNPHEWTDFILPEDRDRVTARFASLTKDATALDIEYRIARPDGEVRWVHARGFPVTDDHGCLIRNIGIITDITDKQRAVAELRASERRFTDLLGNVDMVSMMLDSEGRVTYCNDYLLQLTGWRRDELIGEDWFERFVPSNRDDVRLTFAKLLADLPSAWHFENEILTRSGQPRLIQWNNTLLRATNGDVLGTASIGVDITESKQTESRLRLQSAALNAAGDAILIADRDFRIVWINPAFTELTGYSEGEVLGKDPRDLLRSNAQDSQTFHETISARLLAGETWRGEMTNRRKDGSFYPEAQTITPVRDDDGTIRYFVAIKTDLTAHRQMEGQLRQAQKMEAIGQLAAGVAHEFNNLLQALMSMSAIMRFRAPTPAITKIGTDMEALIKRGAGLTQQLLLFSRHRAIEKMDLDLGEELRKASALLRHLIPETISIVVEISSEPLNIQGDAGQIQQVLLNLAINARDAMNAGGTLTLRTGREGDRVFQEIEDTGHGMDEATQAHLFEPFFTTKEPGKGTGLGLAVAFGIVEQHDGRIEVWSRPGEGSRFRVIFPAALRTTRVRASVPLAEAKVPRGGGRLLLVEDDAPVRAGIASLLELNGYEVTVAGSGEKAMELVLDPPPELLLSDVTLPGIAGPDLAERLRERWPALKVLLMSGYLDEVMRENARRNRWHFLGKPFEFADLARELRVVMDGDPAGSTSAQP